MGPKWDRADEAKWDRTQPPSREAITRLPRWARVAFASRCARRVQSLFKKSWTNADEKHLIAIDSAIALAESSARLASTFLPSSKSTDYAYSTAADARDVALAAATTSAYAAETAADAATHHSEIAALAGDAASHSAQAACGATDQTSDTAWDAAIAAEAAVDAAKASEANDNNVAAYIAVHVHDNPFGSEANRAGHDAANFGYRTRTVDAIWADYDLLCALARREEWRDRSPVDPDLCGPLWPNGAPEGWPAEEPRSDAIGGLTVTFEVPDGVSDEEAVARINEFVDRANELHHSLGGHGLRLIPPIEATQCVAARQGVSS